MKFSIFIFLLAVSLTQIVICDFQYSEEQAEATVENLSQLNERLANKFKGKITDEQIEEYKKNLKSKLDSVKSLPGRESLKAKIQEKLAEMKDIFKNALPSESEWYTKSKEINEEL